MVLSLGVLGFGSDFVGARAPMSSPRRSRAAMAMLLAGAAVLASPVSAATLDLAGTQHIVFGLSGNDNVINSGIAAELVIDTSGGTATNTGLISGTNGSSTKVIKVGANEQILNGHSSYDGGTLLANGTLGFAFSDSLGTGAIEFTGGALHVTSSGVVLANDLLLTSNASISGGGHSPIFAGTITGAGVLTKTGAGSIQINNANNSFGGTIIDGGEILIGASNVLGTQAITVNTGSKLNAVGSQFLDNAVVLNANLTVDKAGSTLSLNGDLTGNFGLNVSGGATLNLFGSANNYHGVTQIDNATLGISKTDSIGHGVHSLVVIDGTLKHLGNSNITVSNAVRVGGTLTVDNSGQTFNLSGDIKNRAVLDTGARYLVGTGTTILSGVNTYSADTVVGEGTLRVDTTTGLGDTYVSNGATLKGTGSLAGLTTILVGGTLAPGNSPGTITLSSLSVQSGSFLNFELGAVGTTGGGVNDYIIVSGNLSIYAATFNFTDVGGFGAGTYRLIDYAGVGTFGAYSLGNTPAGFTSVLDTLTSGQVNLVVTALAPISSTQFWDGAGTVGNNVVNGGTGNWTANGTNWTDSVGSANTVWGNDTAVFAGQAPGVVTVVNTRTFNKLEFDLSGYSLTGGTLAAAGVAEVQVNSNYIATINSAISGSNGLTKTGIGTLVLGGTNSMTGGVVVDQGTLEITSSQALGFGTFTVNADTITKLHVDLANNIAILGSGGSGPTFDVDTNNVILSGVINGTGTITKTGSETLALSGNNVNFSGGINLTEGGLLLLSSNAAGSGPITTTGSVITYANGINSVAPIIVNSNTTQLAVLTGDKATQSGTISQLNGPRGIAKIGAGHLVLTGANTLTGTFALQDGTVTVAGGNNLGTGTLAASNNTRLNVGLVGGQGISLANDITLAGQLTIGLQGTVLINPNLGGALNTDGNTVELAGRITGSGSLVTDAATPGNLIIRGTDADGVNTYSGGTFLNGAYAEISHNQALGTGTVTLANGGILGDGATDLVVANAINVVSGTKNSLAAAEKTTFTGQLTGNAASTVFVMGAGTVALANANNTINGTFEVYSKLQVDGGLTSAGLDVIINNGGTLQGTGTIAGDVTILNGGHLAPGNSAGTLTVGSLVLNNFSLVDYELGQANVIGGSFNDRTIVTGALTLDGLLNVSQSAGGSFGLGVYNLFTYGGLLTDNGLAVVSLPGGATGTIQTLVGGQVNLIVTAPGDLIQYWDGTDMTGEVPGTVLGGSGVWNATNTNWTSDPYQLNASWQNAVGVFAGASAGTVDLQSNVNFSQLQFARDGYIINASGAGGLTVTPGDIIQTGAGVTATINATIGGAGSITKQGIGTLVLNGPNAYAGGTNLTAGNIQVGNNTALGAGKLVMSDQTILIAGVNNLVLANAIQTNGGARIDTGAFTTTINGNIDGVGSISKIGIGNLNLNGTGAYNGLGINQGTVTLGQNTSGGVGIITINNNAILAAGANNLVLANTVETTGGARIDTGTFATMTINGPVTGIGSISHVGPGNLILNGAGSYNGLGINQGTVTLGQNTSGGLGIITINNNAILAAGANNLVLANTVETTGGARIDTGAFATMTINGPVTGIGSISHVGPGNLILNGAGSYNGLGINQGTVTLGQNTSGGIGVITINNNAILAAGANNLVLANTVETTGGARIDTGAFATMTINGPVTGVGSISHVGPGNLILNGAGSYNGLGINQGTVTLGQNTSGGIGIITINNNAILAAGANNLVLANTVETTGGARIDTGTFATMTINGPVTGIGSISHVGPGNLILNGAGSYHGLGINQGTVTLGQNTSGGIGIITINDNAILAAGVNNLVLANTVETTGGARIDTKGFKTTINGPVTGVGSISHVGTGNLVLNGAGSYNGLGINQGTVTLGQNTSGGIGWITINSEAVLAAGVTGLTIANTVNLTGPRGWIDSTAGVFTLNGTVTGAGALAAMGTGNLVLNGNNSYHDLAIYQGQVTLGTNTAGGVGSIIMNNNTILTAGVSGLVLANNFGTIGGARIDSGPGTLTINGDMSGSSGSFSQIGTGNLILNGAGSYDGLGINQGTVTLGQNTSGGIGTITINDQAVLAAGVNNLILANHLFTTNGGRVDTKAFTMTLNGNIDGPGSISQIGTGNLIINGTNNYGGGLGINQGTVTVGTNTAAGTGYITINNGATLKAGVTGLVLANNIETTGAGIVDSGAGSFTLGGHIGNVGGLTKVGTGTLLLTNTSNYSGGTTVAAGRLNVTGALTASTVTVASGGTLGGTGTVHGLIVQAGGTLSPGLSPGTLTVAGNATFAAGSTYALEIAGSIADKLVVTGTAALNGANLAATGGASVPHVFGTTYQILTAAGGRTGAFTFSPTGFSQAFAPTLVYSANDVKLLLAPASLTGLLGNGANGSQNITNLANAFQTAVNGGFNPTSFFAIYEQNPAGIAASLNQLTGEITSANSRTALADSRYIREAALDRLGASLSGTTGGGTTGVNTSGTDENSVSVWARGIGSWTKSDADGNGSHLSIDAKGVITGVDGSFGDWKVGALFNYLESDVETRTLGKGKVRSTGGGIYGGYRGDSGIAFGVGAAASHVRSTENRTVSFPGTTQPLSGKTSGTTYQAFGEVSYDLAAAANTRVEPFLRAAYVEYKVDGFAETGGFAGLNVDKDKYDTTVLTAGLRGSVLLGKSAWLKGSAGYQRTSGDRSPVSLVAIQGTTSQAAIRGVALDKSAFAGELGVDVGLGKNVTLGAGYSGVIGKNTKDNGVKATLTIGF